MFQSTKSSSKFKKEYQEIKDYFGIDWNNVTWSDLRKPLYSALAASLFTSTTIDAGGIPKTTNSQAQFWAAKFRHGGTAANFTQLSNELEGKQSYMN